MRRQVGDFADRYVTHDSASKLVSSQRYRIADAGRMLQTTRMVVVAGRSGRRPDFQSANGSQPPGWRKAEGLLPRHGRNFRTAASL